MISSQRRLTLWSVGRGAGGALADEQAGAEEAGPRHTLLFLHPKGCSDSSSFKKTEKHSFRPASSSGHLEAKVQSIPIQKALAQNDRAAVTSMTKLRAWPEVVLKRCLFTQTL